MSRNRPPHSYARNWFTSVLVAIAAALAVLLTAAPASAAVPTQYHGYTWLGDGTSYIGSFKLSGNAVYCVDADKGPPVGFNYGPVNWGGAGFDPTQRAKLAYIMRTYGASTNNTTAAAVALNVHRITGMDGHSDSFYTSRANGQAGAVLAAANSQRSAMLANATYEASASVTVTLANDGLSGTVQPILKKRTLSGWQTVATGTRSGTLTLTGGTFTDTGLTTRTVTNGTVYSVTPDPGPVIKVDAAVTFTNLPYGNRIGVYSPNNSTRQRLIIADTTTISATGVRTDTPATAADIDFQLEVTTQASVDVAAPGAVLHDTYQVSVVPTAANPNANWSVYGEDPDFFPIPVTIRFQQLGYFDEQPAEQPGAPPGATVLCEVSVTVTAEGGGDTPDCPALPSPGPRGYVVWVASIDPNDTPFGQGRSNVLPFQSPFGVAAETTLIPWQPEVVTRASTPVAAIGTCISDTLTVTGTQPGVPVDIEVPVWGPFPVALAEGTVIDPATAPRADTLTVTATGDGNFPTGCFTAPAPGWYFFTHQSAGAGAMLPFGSNEVFAAETVLIQWAPTVVTAASHSIAEQGTCVSDTITVTGADPSTSLDVDVPLWGPFEVDPGAGSTINTAPAPRVTTDTVTVTGDGTYTTPCHALTEPGWYTRTYSSSGNATTAAFSSNEVFASETTMIRWAMTVDTVTSAAQGGPGSCISDVITVRGMQPGTSMTLNSPLWGPFPVDREPGTTIDTDTAPPAGETNLVVTGDGTYTTPCIVLTEPGSYTFTYSASGNAGTVPASSNEVFELETMAIADGLPLTGVDNTWESVGWGVDLLIGGGAALAAPHIWSAVRRRRVVTDK